MGAICSWVENWAELRSKIGTQQVLLLIEGRKGKTVLF
ncbi:MAG: hypothetical protein M2R45_03046 [Verrucomicrobia subdivision 3 bacterium]|nr:hypothetical protein [Limisphaerales bacterium]MCS1415567.1 hypothetical protein [Limisphaerales bacterium]